MRNNLIEQRKKKKLTQFQIAELLDIGRSTYNAYELGTIDPPLKTAMKIKKILNYENDDIFNESEEIESPIPISKEVGKLYKNEGETMTVEEMQIEKRKLEHEILRKLEEFQKKFKVEVQDLEIYEDIYRLTDGKVFKEKKVNIKIDL